MEKKPPLKGETERLKNLLKWSGTEPKEIRGGTAVVRREHGKGSNPQKKRRFS